MARNLSTYYQNARGFRKESDEFMSNMLGTDYDIVILSETWLHDGNANSEYFTPSFTVFRRDRDYTSGIKYGGCTLIACKQSLNAHRRYDLETYQESVWVEIPSGDGLLFLIGAYYFPPASDAALFVSHFYFLEN